MAYNIEVLADHPTHWWRMTEVPGAVVAHDQGSELRSLWGFSSAPIGFGQSGVAFDGGSLSWSSGQASIRPSASDSDLAPQPYTLEGWYWFPATRTLGSLVAQTNGTNGYGHELAGLTASPQLRAYDQHAGSTTEVLSGLISPHTWYHWVSTHDGTDFKAYLQAVLIATHASTPHAAFSDAFNVGDTPGYYAEIAVYPTALSAARILAHFNNAQHGAAPTPNPNQLSLQADLDRLSADVGSILASVRGSF